MSLHRAWMLLLVVATLGCGEKPQEPEPEVGRDAAMAVIERLGGSWGDYSYSVVRPITVVFLINTQATDADLEHLKGLTDLQWLDLSYTQVTDTGLEHLKGLTRLQRLHLDSTQVTDAGLEHLKGLTSLHTLRLNGTQVTDEGVKKLQEALPNCRISD